MFARGSAVRQLVRQTRCSNLSRRASPNLQLPVASIRKYSPYPKEGVFQPDSPPRTPGPPSFPQQTSQQPQSAPFHPDHYSPGGPPPPPPDYGSISRASGFARRAGRFLTYTIGAGLILLGYETICQNVADLFGEPLVPGSPEDLEELELMMEEFDSLPFVQQLRGMKALQSDGSEVQVWDEWDAYEGFPPDDRRDQRLTTGPLKGSQGLAVQKIFYDDVSDTPHMMHFVCFGRGTCGWPNVVHGGALATLCDEAMGRFSILSVEEQAAVTASLEVNYQQPCRPGEWYVLHITMDPAHASTDRKKYVVANLFCVGSEGPLVDEHKTRNTMIMQIENCHQHLSTKALYVVPKGVALQPLPRNW